MITQSFPAAVPARSYFSQDRDSDHSVREGRHHRSHAKESRDHDHTIQPAANDSSSQQTGTTAPQISTSASQPYNLEVHDLTSMTRKSFEMQMTTKEGDVVTISYNEMNANHQNGFAYDSADGSVNGYSSESAQDSQFKISIEGDLNDDEKQSLHDLMGQMEKVSTDFFAGDTKSAFQQAQKMGFDSEQIAGFSMSLNMEKSVRAVSAYQSVNGQQSVDPRVLKQAGDFYNQAAQGMEGKPQALNVFNNPTNAYNDLGDKIAESVASRFEGLPDLQQHIEALKKLLGLFNNLNGAGQQVPGDPQPSQTSAVESALKPQVDAKAST